jgi:16S rRNA (cytosine1402-N4)-methyltransferase
MSEPSVHHPVLAAEAIEWLHVQPDHWYLDATFGRGGHTRMILERHGRVIAIDCDQAAIEAGNSHFEAAVAKQRLVLVQGNYRYLYKHLDTVQKLLDQPISLSGILFDFGVSSPQLEEAGRGFSFQADGPLDMRMDKTLGVTAADLIAALSVRELTHLFVMFGGESYANGVARAIVQARAQTPFTRTKQLADLIYKVKGGKHGRLHPATKVFQALRIAVNDELDGIQDAMAHVPDALTKKGRVVTISFHEGEDRIVKTSFKNWESKEVGQMLTKHVVLPSAAEIERNPRARSAKLRVFEKN